VLENVAIYLASQEAWNMSDLLGSDPTALVATLLAAVATGLTFLVVLLIYFWGTTLFDIASEKPNQSPSK
jgi:hypothetical protein